MKKNEVASVGDDAIRTIGTLRFPELVAHPSFTLEVLMTREEEILRPAGRGNGRRASWRRKGWEICDRRLLDVVDQMGAIESAGKRGGALPYSLPNS